jgi:hypothetical protein
MSMCIPGLALQEIVFLPSNSLFNSLRQRSGGGMAMKRFPPGMAEELGYYVYLYTDPSTNEPFYVGMGKGNRCFAHLDDTTECDKVKMITRLRQQGREPQIDIIIHGLEDELTAQRIEAAVIDTIGLDKLTNQKRGRGSRVYGRMPVDKLTTMLAAEEVKIEHPSLLIRINQRYYDDMPEDELYESTRGVWKLGVRREQARYAMAVFNGIVQEVYRITAWHPAGTTEYTTRDDVNEPGRWEFTGVVAVKAIRERYLHKSVRGYFDAHQQNPVCYVGCCEGR